MNGFITFLADSFQNFRDFRSGDFENSIKQYGETIGSLEPSYVIKKVNFLSKRIFFHLRIP